MTLLLGLDMGTSSAKAVLFETEANRILATAGHEYPILKPAPDRAEQDPADWWQAVISVTRRATAQAGRSNVTAISFSGQMHGGLLLDEQGQPLHPAIIWPDQRSAAMCAPLVETLGAERYAALAGTLPATGFFGPLLLWLAHHRPDLLARTHRLIMPKDYVRLRMTGHIATDVSDAAGTGLFDITNRAWAEEILSRANLPPHIFPPVLASTEVAGELRPQAAGELGLPAGIPVVTGSADQPAQAIANNLVAPGKASITTGSGGQVLTPVRLAPGSPIKTDPRLHLFNHAVPGMGYILGATLSAGLSLRWLRDVTGLAGAAEAYPTLSAEAAGVPPGADGLLFLPYLTGERTPHMDPLARGGFIGLTAYHRRGHLARAIMEGVTFSLRQALEISLELGGQVESLIAAGGGASSDVWRQIQADILGLPLQQSLLGEQAGVGAALIGGVGAGCYPDLVTASGRAARFGPLTEPAPARHQRYNRLYGQFTELYPRLRDDFHRLAQFTTA